MLIVHSHNGVPIRLTEERWQHIVLRHPEMQELQEKVAETLVGPHIIQQGDAGELIALRFYSEAPVINKFVVVIYKETSQEDGFILTAYLSNFPNNRRTTIWKQ